MRTSDRGFTSLNLLPVLMCAILSFLGIGHYIAQQLTIGRAGRSKYAALLAAESGVDSAVQMIASNNSFTGESLNLPATNLIPFGSFSTTVSRINPTSWRVLSTGTYRDGTRARVAALLQNSQRHPGSAAIMANRSVSVNGSVSIVGNPQGTGGADLLSNGNIFVGGSATVDGSVGAVGSVTISGQANVKETHNGINPIVFPSNTTITTWKNEWMAQGQSGGTILNGITASTVVNGSKFIDGDINLTDGSLVELRGPGTVFVKGNLRLGATARLRNSAELVVLGTVSMADQSVYSAVWNGSGTTPGIWIFGNETNDAGSITATMQGGSDADSLGIVSVLYGSLRLTGSNAIRGALSVNQGSAILDLSGTYRQTFIPNMVSSRPNPQQISVSAITEY